MDRRLPAAPGLVPGTRFSTAPRAQGPRSPGCGRVWRTVTFLCVLALLALRAPAATSADLNVAGLVVDYGDGRMSYAWVPFPEEEITGLELLRRSGLDVVTVGFGGLGEGVCQIEDTGCPVSECRVRLCQTSDSASPFWQYVQETEPGVWTPYALGAGESRVRDGSIEGWTWSGVAPELPALSLADIAERAGADPAQVEREHGAVPVALRTEGAAGEDEGLSPSILGGAAVVAGVALLAGLAVWRSRAMVDSR